MITRGAIQYDSHLGIKPGTICEACGLPAKANDHCHAHGWVRGAVCVRCNLMLRHIDRNITPVVEPALLAALLALWQRCPECAGYRRARPENTNKNTGKVTAMMPEELIARLDAYAKAEERSRSAVITIAVRQFLDREQENTPGG